MGASSRQDPPVSEHRSSPVLQETFTPISRFGTPQTTKPADARELEKKPYYPRVKEVLTNVFHLPSFRALQLEVICDVMEGRDVFVLFPTGSGKSLTFQLPAVCQDGMTIVVSPLKSLITDQHRALKALGVDVEVLLGEMADSQRKEVWRRLGSGDVPKLLYLTPERLDMDGMRNLLQRLQSSGQLVRFVIDEAHLITDWGRSFRDAYVRLNTLRTTYPGVPISALTATASPEVQGDIVTRLHLKIRAPWKLSANRPNLDYDVRHKGKNVLDEIAGFIKSKWPRETGIIYCLSRDKCEEVAKLLRDKFQLSAKHYHAAMAEQDKAQVQQEWSSGRIRIIVATIAFGMGIDKADVRYVIHHSLPSSLNGYYQETGRGGRDGKLAQCILYYNKSDFYNRLRMIRGNPPSEMRDAEEDDIRRVMGYVTNDVQCRRAQVLAFFHEDFDPAHCRQMCNNCRNTTPFVNEDHTADAQKALRLFESLSRRPRARITPAQFIAALKGSKAQIQVERGWANDPLHGSCSHLTNDVLERLVDQMQWHNFLAIEQIVASKDGYCQNYLTVSVPGLESYSAPLTPVCF
ncbi:ATP-dependent DNA helicase [Trametes sanguinea]|nr:ATP-dependent DNA helicase [Trametes sanguinea]